MALSAPFVCAIRLSARDPASLAAFFVEALGFERAGAKAGELALALGESRLLVGEATGAAYPAAVPGWSLLFQHFAMATADMAASVARLGQASGWTAISAAGPERLPESSGGVVAFKFRDPEGHPLELIEFPKRRAVTPRIDHSAISVASTAASLSFYEALGFALGAQTLNHGPEQARLDGVEGARVEVTTLLAAPEGPHLELLCYLGDYPREAGSLRPEDVAATQLLVEIDALASSLGATPLGATLRGSPALARDPDGHLLQLRTRPAAR